MRESTLRRIKELGLNKEDFQPKKEPKLINISREDFDLLDVLEEATYYIAEENGTITMLKGENV